MTPLRAADHSEHDAIVIGGGPAGASAALVLGRARRRTLVLDAGRPRNAPAPAAHGVFTRDGTPPLELLAEARRQLDRYPSVEWREAAAISARSEAGGFVVTLADGTDVRGRRLLLAVGVRDQLPPVEGFATHWGTGVLHCAYCHAWEVRDQALALHGRGADALEAAAMLLGWTRDLLLCSDGPAELSGEQRDRLVGHGVRIVETPLRALEGEPPRLRLAFADGRTEPCRAVFVSTRLDLASPIPDLLGCEREAGSRLRVGPDRQTSVPGVYAAGDIVTAKKQVAIAAASGVEAAMALNGDLAQQDFGGEWSRPPCASAGPLR